MILFYGVGDIYAAKSILKMCSENLTNMYRPLSLHLALENGNFFILPM